MDGEFNKIMKTARNQKITLNELGTDSLTECGNKDHFLNYKKKITYKFNEYGYRDDEWPSDLSDVIWCVGDSATMGVGQPFEETWPQILQKKISKRCLNISSGGCSNDTMRVRAQFIHENFKPKTMIIMWSFISRRRIEDKDMQYDKKDFGVKSNILNFLRNFEKVNKLPIKIIHSIIPNELNELSNDDRIKYLIDKKTKKSIVYFQILDYARDHHHFDIKTSELVTNLMIEKIDTIDNTPKYPV